MAKYSLLKNKDGGRVLRNNKTGELVFECEDQKRYSDLRRKALNNMRQAAFSDAMHSVGMVKTPYGWE